jgi:D-alanyl-D-alanine carboxypeptidase (penicillin-binding protein 5/6)
VQDGVRRIIVLNGLDSDRKRALESQRLMRIAFNDFTNKTLYKPGDIVGEALVFKGVAASVPLIAKEPVTMILHRSQAQGVKATVVYEGPVAAPIAKNQQIGYLHVATGAGDPREYPLYAGRAVKEMGVFGKIALAAKTLLARPEDEAPTEATP